MMRPKTSESSRGAASHRVASQRIPQSPAARPSTSHASSTSHSRGRSAAATDRPSSGKLAPSPAGAPNAMQKLQQVLASDDPPQPTTRVMCSVTVDIGSWLGGGINHKRRLSLQTPNSRPRWHLPELSKEAASARGQIPLNAIAHRRGECTAAAFGSLSCSPSPHCHH